MEPQLVTGSAKIHYVRAPKLPINCAENMSEICLISVGGSLIKCYVYVINEVSRPWKKQTIGHNPVAEFVVGIPWFNSLSRLLKNAFLAFCHVGLNEIFVLFNFYSCSTEMPYCRAL